MFRDMTPEEKHALRQCLDRFVALLRKLRQGGDVTEDLRDEVERTKFNPVCLLAAAEERAPHVRCRVCEVMNRPKNAPEFPRELRAMNAFQSAADGYLADPPIPDASQDLSESVCEIIRTHWNILHSRKTVSMSPK